jgi:uncharacterized membrane protein
MNISALIGHFHPLLVHLPIGILILGILIAFAGQRQKWQHLTTFLPFILLWGAISAIFACVTGYILALNGEYKAELLDRHQWSGIVLAIVTTIAYLNQRFGKLDNKYVLLANWLFIGGLLVVVGHYGGSMTHGVGYMTEGVFEKKEKKKDMALPIDTVQNQQVTSILNGISTLPASVSTNQSATQTTTPNPKTAIIGQATMPQNTPPENPIFVYKDLIQPILEQRCYSCHGENKSKGDLRLDSPEYILKGGETGKVLVAGNVEKSLLYAYCVLPLEDDLHMPPDGKPQLTAQQVQLLKWWVEHGASFDKTVQELNGGKNLPIAKVNTVTPSVFQPVQSSKTAVAVNNDVKNSIIKVGIDEKPSVPKQDMEPILLKQSIEPVSSAVLKNLTEKKIIVSSYGENSNYVMANFINVKNYSTNLIDDLQNVKNQLLRLRLSNQPVTDADVVKIAQFKNITRLNLEKTNITDASLATIAQMPNLEQLNIYGTNVTEKGLERLANCPNLKVLYIWETKATTLGIENLRKILRGVKIESGNLRFIDTLKK